MPVSLNLDPQTYARLTRAAEVWNRPPEAILREALDEYLKGKEISKITTQDRHPSGKPWPQRKPVGGIITPV